MAERADQAETDPVTRLRDTRFPMFYLARLLCLAGAVITAVALPLLVLGASGNFLLTALVTTTATSPYLLFGLLAGAVADKYPRRHLIVFTQLTSALALASIPVTSVLGHQPTPAHALVVSFMAGTCFVFFDAACFGVVPTLVPRRELVRANSLLWVAGSLIDATFPAVAGVLVVWLTAAGAISVEVMLLCAAVTIFAVMGTALNQPVTQTARTATLLAGVTAGLRFLWQHRLIRLLTLLGGGSAIVNGVVVGLLAVFTRTLLAFPEGDWRSGLAWTATAVGAALGAALLPKVRTRVGVGYITLGALSTYPVLLAGLAWCPWAWGRLALLLCWGMMVSIVVLNGIALRQEATPLELQSRVNTTARMIAWGGTPLGALLGGILAHKMGPEIALWVATGIAVLLVTVAWSTRLHRLTSAESVS